MATACRSPTVAPSSRLAAALSGIRYGDQWMQQRGCDRVGFAELLDGVSYPVIKGWLAILLDEGFAIN